MDGGSGPREPGPEPDRRADGTLPPEPSRAARSRRRRARVRGTLLVAIALLYALSVPWYRTPGEAPALWLGLPDWVAVALGCYMAVAVLNAAAWLVTEVPDAEEER